MLFTALISVTSYTLGYEHKGLFRPPKYIYSWIISLLHLPLLKLLHALDLLKGALLRKQPLPL